tara:strand:+ start:1940 stop:3667 length:1728 start_codon:yes stop_codon:yes gene_type:complete
MPKPTLQQRDNFKAYLRHFKKKFTSNLQKIPFFYLENIMTQKSVGISTSDEVNVVIFDNNEYVAITTAFNNNELIYIPGLPGETVTLGIGTGSYKFEFVGDDQGLKYNGSTLTLDSEITIGNYHTNDAKKLTIKGLGGGMIQGGNAPPPPTYSLTQTVTSINEGGSVGFTVATTNVADSTNLYYNLSGTATADDFVGGTLAGSFTINNNSGTFVVISAGDAITDDNETFTAYVRTGSTSGPIVATSSQVTIGDVAQTVSIAPSVTTVDEGQQIQFVITSTGYSPTSTFYYDIVGATTVAGDFTDNTLTGSFSTTNNVYSLVKLITTDNISDDGETFVVNIRTGSNSGTIVATSPTITVNDVAQSIVITQDKTDVNEGQDDAANRTITFTVTATGYAAGAPLYWSTLTTAGAVTAADFTDNTLEGSQTLDNNNQITVVRKLVGDRATEGIEKFKLEIRTGSATGTVIATSDEITINDISVEVGAFANGKTFGPVQVNRDNGDASMASDWYTICNIDNIPDGSKIALFVDGSGSMTPGDVQASIDLLNTKLAARGITIITVTNSEEDWITPFLTTLA